MKAEPDLQGFDRIYERIGLYRSHLEWIKSQDALRGLPEPVLQVLAAQREGLGKGKLLDWLEPRKGQSILDNGCGVGYFIFDVLVRYPSLELRFVGTELSSTGLRLLNERVALEAKRGILGAAADVRHLPLPDASFDAVICSEVLDHTPEPERAIHEMARVLVPGGKLLMTVPNGEAERFWDGLRDAGRRLRRRPPAEDEYYETFLSLDDVRRWVGEAGLTILKEELNTAIPLGTIVRRCPRPLQLAAARTLAAVEPFLRFRRLATNYIVLAAKDG